MMLIAVVLGLLVAPQEAPAGPSERIVLVSREVIEGEIENLQGDRLSVRCKDGKVRGFGIEEVSRMQFESAPSMAVEAGEKLRLAHGGMLTGRAVAYAGERGFGIETANGTFAVARGWVRSVALAAPDGELPELKEPTQDMVVYRRRAEDKDLALAAGVLERITQEVLTLRKPDGDRAEIPRASVRTIYLHGDKPRADVAMGWFARVAFKNGDRVIGTLRGVQRDRVTLFSHLVGTISVRKSQIHSISFASFARTSVGNLVVAEMGMVREFDRTGKTELWRFQRNNLRPWGVTKLDNGNVLIADADNRQLLEVRPTGPTGGEVVWQLENLNHPVDARRLDSGNTLVVEQYSNRIAEYEPRNNSVVWQMNAVSFPTSIQRLDNGHTIVCSQHQVLEYGPKWEEKWRATLAGVRAWKAERLENGNTLIVDRQRGQVVEIDASSKEVWKKSGLAHPVAAVRLDDECTIVVEQGRQQIVEIDPSGKTTVILPQLNYPMHVSTY